MEGTTENDQAAQVEAEGDDSQRAPKTPEKAESTDQEDLDPEETAGKNVGKVVEGEQEADHDVQEHIRQRYRVGLYKIGDCIWYWKHFQRTRQCQKLWTNVFRVRSR